MTTAVSTRTASSEPLPRGSAPSGPDPLTSQLARDAQIAPAGEGHDSPQAKVQPVPMGLAPAGITTAPPATEESVPRRQAPEGHETSHGQVRGENQNIPAVAADIPGGHNPREAAQMTIAAGDQFPPATAKSPPMPNGHAPWPADEWLGLAAQCLDDLEKARIAAENRIRELLRSGDDPDGVPRGWGLDPEGIEQLAREKGGEAFAIVQRLMKTMEHLAAAEHQSVLNLQYMMRRHPLGPWLAAQKGIGEKQGARLLGVIGDPYIRPRIDRADGTSEPERPRTLYELWAYCGLKPGQKRKRGERANWSADAKMRAWNIAVSMLKAGNREVYDKRKALTEGRLHESECVRCGPSGRPALPGSPWSDAHRHADALRIVMKKAVLEGLHREARRIHETPVSGQGSGDTQTAIAADGG